MTIGIRIRKLRASKGLSQVKLAQLAGTTRQAVSKWENDLSSPDTMHLITLAEILGTDVEYLATGKLSASIAECSNPNRTQAPDQTFKSNSTSPSVKFILSPLLVILVSILSFLGGIIFSLLLIILS